MLFRESRNERIGFWRLDQILAENPFVRQSFAQLEGKLQPLILLLTFFAMKVYLPSHIYTKNAPVKYFQRLNVPSPCAQNDTVIVPDRLVFQVRRAQKLNVFPFLKLRKQEESFRFTTGDTLRWCLTSRIHARKGH